METPDDFTKYSFRQTVYKTMAKRDRVFLKKGTLVNYDGKYPFSFVELFLFLQRNRNMAFLVTYFADEDFIFLAYFGFFQSEKDERHLDLRFAPHYYFGQDFGDLAEQEVYEYISHQLYKKPLESSEENIYSSIHDFDKKFAPYQPGPDPTGFFAFLEKLKHQVRNEKTEASFWKQKVEKKCPWEKESKDRLYVKVTDYSNKWDYKNEEIANLFFELSDVPKETREKWPEILEFGHFSIFLRDVFAKISVSEDMIIRKFEYFFDYYES